MEPTLKMSGPRSFFFTYTQPTYLAVWLAIAQKKAAGEERIFFVSLQVLGTAAPLRAKRLRSFPLLDREVYCIMCCPPPPSPPLPPVAQMGRFTNLAGWLAG
jgi:hypothetical protein